MKDVLSRPHNAVFLCLRKSRRLDGSVYAIADIS